MKPGDVLNGRYRLLELLGKGGMAEVWKAYDSGSRREVAVKLVRPLPELADWFDTDDMNEGRAELHGRFRREGALLADLDHPGIPELYDRGTHGDRPYIVMRLVEGSPLHRFLAAHRPLPRPVVVAIASQIAAALRRAHEVPVVHRDLKPQNVIIARDGTVVLIDFGIAMPLRPGVTRYTARGATLGSRGYMAPEQIREEQLTPHTDLYALGCVLFELFTGRQPFDPDGEGGIIVQHLHSEPPSVHDLVSGVPEDLAELTRRLLAKGPYDRPLDAGEVLEALSSHLPGPGTPAPSPRVDPDPTLPFREPRDLPRPGNPADARRSAPSPLPARSHRTATWLSRRNVEEILAEVRNELVVGEAGPATERLVALLPDARRQFGADQLVRAALIACADSLRIAGDCGRAGALYRQLVDDLGYATDPPFLAASLIARLGVAECRIPFGELDAALDGLRVVVSRAGALPAGLAGAVGSRCEDLGVELSELGRGEEVGEILALLPRRAS
ncbi:serine/threonine-protein kinase [Streptosporangium vulgare]|uniref:non-specific serine/threonine protein kinase n=1 Tax=Streptosporangium vulgare TaxID=46190 RepID=A0ABV5TCB9_9ACTN